MPLRLAAISFLNPAPLLYDFEHSPRAAARFDSGFAARYDLHYTSPAQCAQQLLSGEADLGLIPIASLTAELAIVPGCTIASLAEVRSILLLVKNPQQLSEDAALRSIRILAADAASRSSQAYVEVILKHFLHTSPTIHEAPADAIAMLRSADAALLIGDPALVAREQQTAINSAAETPLLWLDLAALWRRFTGLPWVAAVWAVRPEALAANNITSTQLIADLNASRDAGLAHIDEIVREWQPRIALPTATISTYLTHNIHYALDADCLAAIRLLRSLAAEHNILPPLDHFNLLAADNFAAGNLVLPTSINAAS